MSKQILSLSKGRSQFKYDFLVFIGRFQPFHLGHQAVVREALKQSRRLIMLVGSASQPRSLRNPWSFSERKAMIKASFSSEEVERISIAPLLDNLYNDQAWIKSVQQTVHGLVVQYPERVSEQVKIGLIGHSKDHSSYYLSLFPQWGAVGVDSVDGLSSTPIREAFFMQKKVPEGLNKAVSEQLQQMMETEAYDFIAEEQVFINRYKQGWEAAPYEPMFITVDALVIQSGHILLIERKARPGKGLWALPGGFLDPHEKLADAVIRELREETRIKVPAPVLQGSIKNQQVFDDPHRSSRGRTVTHAFLIQLRDDANGLPKVKGGDDAAHAFWVPLADVQPEHMFEDHFHIIQTMLG